MYAEDLLVGWLDSTYPPAEARRADPPRFPCSGVSMLGCIISTPKHHHLYKHHVHTSAEENCQVQTRI
jgi:hypothetical protein